MRKVEGLDSKAGPCPKEVRAGGTEDSGRQQTGNLARWLLIAGGSSSLGLGILGIFLPLLPTTPLLLLAAACYARSSDRFYNWLLGNRWFGSYIRGYREGKGVPARVKIATLCLLWLTIGASAVFAVDAFPARIVLLLIAAGVTAHVISIGPSKR